LFEFAFFPPCNILLLLFADWPFALRLPKLWLV